MHNITKDKKFFISVISFTTSFIVSVYAEIKGVDWKENIFIILDLGIFVPLFLYGREMFKITLEKKNILVTTEPEMGPNQNFVFSTNIFGGTKNIFLRGLLNLFGDLVINILFSIYILLIFAISFVIAYYFTKMLEIII